MPNNACTPHNAMAKLAGVFEAGGIETTEDAINVLDDNAKLLFHQVKSQSAAQALKASSPMAAKDTDELIDSITETDDPVGLKDKIKGGLMDLLKPADYLPHDVTGPVFEFLDNFFAQNHNNLSAARGQYKAGIRSVLNQVSASVEKLDPASKGQAAHWMRDLREGYPFYSKGGTLWNHIQNSAVSNVLDFSGTVLLGNPLEILVKAPSVYGITPTFQGLTQLIKETKGNIWAEIPELKAAGVYGMEMPAGKGKLASLAAAYKKINETVMNASDRPLKNLGYAIGKAKGGTSAAGTEAVERIAFKNRWGNDPRVARSNKDAITLMNYTFNTYHMLGGMGKGLLTPGKRIESARQLGMWMGLTAMIGGPAAVIPAPVSAILGQVDGYKEWEAEHLNTLGKLIQPGSISVGIGTELVNRAGQAWQKGTQSGAKKLSQGDTGNAMLDFADAGMAVSTLLARNPLGNLRVQKTLKTTRQLITGDMDFQQYLQKEAETFLPALKAK